MGINLVQNCRNRIITAQPHLETASGQSIVIEKGFSAPLKSCIATINPIQVGSGDPSPTNVKEISGYTGLSIYVSPTTSGGTEYPVSWSEYGTIYGGVINLITGEITQNYQLFSFDGTENWETVYFGTPTSSSRIMLWLDTISGHNNYDQYTNRPVYCSHFSYGGTGSTTWGEYRYNPTSGTPPRAYFTIVDPNAEHFGTLANFEQFLADQATNGTPVQVLIPLTVPKHYQINPVTLKTLCGINHIWSDAGTVSLQYWTH